MELLGVLHQKEPSGLIQTILPSKVPNLDAALGFMRSVLRDGLWGPGWMPSGSSQTVSHRCMSRSEGTGCHQTPTALTLCRPGARVHIELPTHGWLPFSSVACCVVKGGGHSIPQPSDSPPDVLGHLSHGEVDTIRPPLCHLGCTTDVI